MTKTTHKSSGFADLGISPAILNQLNKLNFNTPTPIQHRAIPIAIGGQDLMGIAQTGTGKTAAFVLPILHLLSTEIKSIEPNSPLVLVLSPTRELAMQIDKTFERFGKHLKIKHTAIFGGVSQEPQIKILSKGIQVLTATPGRLLDLISHDKVNLSSVEYIVLDEAHTYRGVFGSHVSLILRRLLRICKVAGADPIIAASSATIANLEPYGFTARRVISLILYFERSATNFQSPLPNKSNKNNLSKQCSA